MAERDCLPGGACPHCNPAPLWCQGCTEVEVENADDLCASCQEKADEEARYDAGEPAHEDWGSPLPEAA